MSTLTNQQLFDDFLYCCYYWAYTNGDTNFTASSVTLADPGNQKIQISSWTSTAPQPTIAQLQAITLTQIAAVKRKLNIQQIIANSTVQNATTTEINAIASPPTGLMLFDSVLNQLKIYYNGAWNVVTT